MLTRCNHCETCFEINERLVRDNDATVACGECGTIFDARLNLVDEYSGEYYRFADDLPATEAAIDQHVVEEVGPDQFGDAADDDYPPRDYEHDFVVDPAAEIERTVALDRSGLDAPYAEQSSDEYGAPQVPTFAGEERVDGESGLPAIYLEDYPALANDLLDHKRIDGLPAASAGPVVESEVPPVPASGNLLHRGSWMLSIGLLLCGVVVAAIGYRDWIAHSSLPRPARAAFCNFVGCELPLQRAIEQLTIVNKSSYSHPTVENALIVTVDLRNDAAFAQPYPSLSVMMADEQGRTVAQRDFSSADYLSAEFRGQRLPPGEHVRIDLEVVDPGPSAKSFEIGLF